MPSTYTAWTVNWADSVTRAVHPRSLVAGVIRIPGSHVGTSGTSGGVLRRGSTGPAVAQLQRQLGVPADGHFGPVTERAVQAFQRRHHLAADGVVGLRTKAALQRVQPPPKPPLWAVATSASGHRKVVAATTRADIRAWLASPVIPANGLTITRAKSAPRPGSR